MKSGVNQLLPFILANLCLFISLPGTAQELTNNQKTALRMETENLQEFIKKIPKETRPNNLSNTLRLIGESVKDVKRTKLTEDHPGAAEFFKLVAEAKELVAKQDELLKKGAAVKASADNAAKTSGAKNNACESVRKYLKKAMEKAEEAKKDKRTGFFEVGGGVFASIDDARRELEKAKKLGVDGETVSALKLEIEQTEKQGKEMGNSLKEQELADMKMPDEKYQGEDKEKLKALVSEEWKKTYPNDEILSIRFHADWKRDAKMEWIKGDKAFKASDWSALPVSVIVKTSPTVASIYVAYVNKNNLTGSIAGVGCNTKKGEYVIDEILLKNVKP